MQLRRCLRQLRGARPLDETHRVQRPRSKKRAAKRSLALKKLLACSQRQHVMTVFLLQRTKIPRCYWRQRVETSKIKPFVTKGP